jgi:hypothetical protein
MSTPTDLFPGFTTPPTHPSRDLRPAERKEPPMRTPAAKESIPFTREYYTMRCRAHWDREPLRDAIGNWSHFRELHEALSEAMRRFKSEGRGSLKPFLWDLQKQISPNQNTLHPLLDFCDHYQRIFLRRGLVIYCEMILAQLET